MKSKKGILLLEVMVSIVVITSGLLFVMRVYSTAKEALDRSRDMFKYSFLLEEKMYDFEEKGAIEEGRAEDHFPEARDYSWSVDAVSLAPEGQNMSDLCSVKLDVFSNKVSTPDKYSIFTYIGKKK